MNKQKINEKVFMVRLTRAYKKASYRELQLTQLCLTTELNRRHKKGEI